MISLQKLKLLDRLLQLDGDQDDRAAVAALPRELRETKAAEREATGGAETR